MPTAIVLPARSYERLVRELRALLEDAQDRARDAVAREAARAYWEVGKRLARERLVDRPSAHGAVHAKLAEDLGIHVRTLRRAEAFFAAFPKRPPADLGWAHARELLRLHDDDARTRFADLAREEGLSVRKLAAAINEHLRSPEPHSIAPRGRPRIERPADPTYIYAAELLRVVDGDTLDLRIDLGFDVDKRHRIRLAAIDAPELRMDAGQEARRFVEQTLTSATTIVIQTRKFDLHGRYVAHLFFSKEDRTIGEVFANGRYLNQILLDSGHAELYAKRMR